MFPHIPSIPYMQQYSLMLRCILKYFEVLSSIPKYCQVFRSILTYLEVLFEYILLVHTNSEWSTHREIFIFIHNYQYNLKICNLKKKLSPSVYKYAHCAFVYIACLLHPPITLDDKNSSEIVTIDIILIHLREKSSLSVNKCAHCAFVYNI